MIQMVLNQWILDANTVTRDESVCMCYQCTPCILCIAAAPLVGIILAPALSVAFTNAKNSMI